MNLKSELATFKSGSHHLPLAERRALLEQVGTQLLPGGSQANQYRESVIYADVDVPVP